MARGSRYRINGQLVGPGVMEQLSWVDISKARLHIGEVFPTPFNGRDLAGETPVSNIITITLASSARNVGGGVLTPVVGDIVRIVNANFASSTDNGFIKLEWEDSDGARPYSAMDLGPGTHYLVIPPAFGEAAMAALRFTTGLAATGEFPLNGSHTNVRLDFIKDD